MEEKGHTWQHHLYNHLPGARYRTHSLKQDRVSTDVGP